MKFNAKNAFLPLYAAMTFVNPAVAKQVDNIAETCKTLLYYKGVASELSIDGFITQEILVNIGGEYDSDGYKILELEGKIFFIKNNGNVSIEGDSDTNYHLKKVDNNSNICKIVGEIPDEYKKENN